VDGLSKVGLPAWLIAVLSSWAVSVEVGSAVTLGYAVQWALKAPAKVADWVAPLVVVVGGAVLYVFVLGHAPTSWPPSNAWVGGLVLWTAAALGTASASGLTGGAPATNSLNKEVAK
jgi:sterol desaturase/sphingolipid hydroxylase (fatty acid hydroxylase superfamily)